MFISSRNILNLVLLAVILLLVTLVFLKPGQNPELEPVKLSNLSASDITHIQIKRKDSKTIIFQKENSIWWMKEPYNLPANDFRIQSVVRLVEAESSSQHDLSKLNLTEFSLDDPEVSIIFNHDTKLDFGSIAPLKQSRYISVNGKLYLVADSAYYHLIGNENNFLSHSLLPTGSRIEKMELPELTLTLTDGKWIRNPVYPDISADATTDLLNEWHNTQALELRTDNSINGNTIKIYLQGQSKPVELIMTITEDDFILARKDVGIQYIFPVEQMDRLLKLPATIDAENAVTDSITQPEPVTAH